MDRGFEHVPLPSVSQRLHHHVRRRCVLPFDLSPPVHSQGRPIFIQGGSSPTAGRGDN
ncbi:hypothetical protein M378DRAFT_167699 [Amanita muscaria Koide BX008]|uniref:Uncharacterized protein n=1 Tax=Amanita muscaria (strain Koide BX008) TaxID=946122 RepID=A0A0C2WWL3_AMAMK|nr:hypothetical protein M378DRAFT_167699 [Amanita muscaria Koide BX008]